ncbi:serine/threonine-protein kinase [Streptomyces sp. NPDC086091]|uniref:serine/threonine-protein kinase n=1 Tax=Streptomyces sp. NPDC086091 TaxID=3365751 RepID=UPI0038019009
MHDQDGIAPDKDGEALVAGRYRLLSRLGEGGMGTVWRARDEVLHREVAVKEVRASAALTEELTQRLYSRMEREAWAAARVNARGVVTVYDVATHDERPWIVMELVSGESLADRIGAKGALPPREVARIGAEVLAALRAAHNAGVLHRDVKPANVLLAEDGRVVLTDFGIATIEGDTALTMTGEVIGSPEYLAPERALGRDPGPASDLWSLGALLYTAVQGRSPFRRTSALATLRAVVDEELPPAHKAGPLKAVIDGLMTKDPATRTTAEAAARELGAVLYGTPAPDTATLTTAVPDTAVPDTDETATAALPAEETATAGVTAVDGVTAVEGVPAGPTGPVTGPTATVQAPAAPAAPAAAPTVPTPTPTPTPTAQNPVPAAVPAPVPSAVPEHAPHTPAPSAPASRGRRTGLLIAAAVTALALIGGGVGYALMGDGGDDGKDAGGKAGGNNPVSVTVRGQATTYSGACPAPQGQAPWFTATFTAAQQPTQISYRWVSANGSVVDKEWRTLSFRADDPSTHEETVRLTTYAQEGTLSSAMAVEIKAPFGTVSNSVPFSVTCGSVG